MDEQTAAAQLEHVRRYISLSDVGLGSGHAKLFATMGDRVATGIARALFPRRTAEGHLLRKILFVLRTAFSFTPLVEDPADRVPSVTFLLLEALAASARSQEERNAIAETTEEIKSLTANVAKQD